MEKNHLKKYRLIRKYPGSPELDTVVFKTNGDGDYSYVEPSIKEYSKQLIEKNPEFWQEVVEKEYQILKLAFKRSDRPEIRDVSDYGSEYLESLIKCENTIYSVKRLSDGVVFTVGDYTNAGNLTGFSIKNNKVITHHKPSGEDLNDDFYLEGLKHVKKPIFTTEDCVDIFEGDEYFEVITPDFHNKSCIWNILPNKTRGNINYDQKGNKKHGRIWFSTKEKAEEYILMNRPCLSINDVKGYLIEGDLSELKTLVKEKIKL